MRFFLGLVDEVLQIAFAGCALGCDDRPLDAAAAQGVCTENLSSGVVVMKPAQDGA